MIGTFFGVGFTHILSWGAIDHLLFLAALAACYQFSDWRHGLTVITSFTIGHSLTLVMTTLTPLKPPISIVEFLIPITVVFAAWENLYQGRQRPVGYRRPILAGVFGLVHGAGFSTTLRGLFDHGIVKPLLGFNLGIEAGQVVVLAALAVAFYGIDKLLKLAGTGSELLWRTRVTSSAIITVALMMAIERIPW